MNIGIITTVFNEPDFIKPCIKQFDGFNFPHLILVSKKPYCGDIAMDETWALAQMNINNGEVFIGEWSNQADHINTGLEILGADGIDWALIVDADEFYTPEDIGRLVGQIRTTKYDAIYASFMDVYWKTPSHKIRPDQYDYPIVAIRTNCRFKDKRHVQSSVITTGTLKEITLHHMSYVRTDNQMKKKIESFEHSREFNTTNWFNDVWLPWNEDSKNMHPVVPQQFEAAYFSPAPSEILDLLDGIPR